MSSLSPDAALAAARDYLTSQDVSTSPADPVVYQHWPSSDQGIEFTVANGSAVLWAEPEVGSMALSIADYLDPNAPIEFTIDPDLVVDRLAELVDRGLIPAS